MVDFKGDFLEHAFVGGTSRAHGMLQIVQRDPFGSGPKSKPTHVCARDGQVLTFSMLRQRFLSLVSLFSLFSRRFILLSVCAEAPCCQQAATEPQWPRTTLMTSWRRQAPPLWTSTISSCCCRVSKTTQHQECSRCLLAVATSQNATKIEENPACFVFGVSSVKTTSET